MRNIEYYPDPTAGKAMQERPERLSSIQGPQRKAYPSLPPGKVPAVGYEHRSKIKYINKPVYVAK